MKHLQKITAIQILDRSDVSIRFRVSGNKAFTLKDAISANLTVPRNSLKGAEYTISQDHFLALMPGVSIIENAPAPTYQKPMSGGIVPFHGSEYHRRVKIARAKSERDYKRWKEAFDKKYAACA